jgi:hypothetical protein
MAANDPEEWVTVFLVWLGKRSNKTLAPQMERSPQSNLDD